MKGLSVSKSRIIGAPVSEDQSAIIDLLKETLAQALEGNIKTVGVVACLEGGFATVMAGRQAADLNLGCDELKRKILLAVTEGTEERQSRRSSQLFKMQ
jgi:hypothetical protein